MRKKKGAQQQPTSEVESSAEAAAEGTPERGEKNTKDIPFHLEGGTAEIRFVMGPGRVWRVAYITTKCTKRNAGARGP
jgi:hypothetical protein